MDYSNLKLTQLQSSEKKIKDTINKLQLLRKEVDDKLNLIPSEIKQQTLFRVFINRDFTLYNAEDFNRKLDKYFEEVDSTEKDMEQYKVSYPHLFNGLNKFQISSNRKKILAQIQNEEKKKEEEKKKQQESSFLLSGKFCDQKTIEDLTKNYDILTFPNHDEAKAHYLDEGKDLFDCGADYYQDEAIAFCLIDKKFIKVDLKALVLGSKNMEGCNKYYWVEEIETINFSNYDVKDYLNSKKIDKESKIKALEDELLKLKQK